MFVTVFSFRLHYAVLLFFRGLTVEAWVKIRQIIAIIYVFRELAIQISQQFEVFGKPINVSQTVVTGGRGKW